MADPEQNLPNWLTKEFLEKLLSDNQYAPGAENTINITHHYVENFLSKGNNFSSTMLRINIEYSIVCNGAETSKKTSLIAKIPLQEGPLISVIQKGVVETEVEAYKEMLPKLNEIMENENAEDNFIPKMFKTDIENLMILEDLNASGYSMLDRKQQLDYDHCILTIKNLAKFHAASVKLQEREPELIEKFKTDAIYVKNMDDDVRDEIDSILGEGLIEIIIQEFDRRPETRKYVDFLTILKHKFWDVYLDAITPSDGEFKVLNHGDLWVNNVLYKYDHSSRPQTLKFLDFQLLRCTSPTVDLLNFLHTSISFDVLNSNFNHFTQTYLHDLNLYLEKYGCSQRLDEVEYKRSLKEREIFSLLLCVVVLPHVLNECDESDGILEADESHKPQTFPIVKFVQNERYRTICTKYLDEFSKRNSFKTFQ